MGGLYKSIWFDNLYYSNSGTVPNWKENSGTWSIASKTLYQANAAVQAVIVPADTGGNAIRSLTQDRKTIYEWRQKLVDSAGAAERGGLIWCADAATGDYLGNSYVFEQTAGSEAIYRSTADVLGAALDSGVVGVTLGTWYYYRLVWDPDVDTIVVYRDTTYPATTEILSASDSSLSSNPYAGLWTDDSEAYFDEIDWHFDYESDLLELEVVRCATYGGGFCRFSVPQAPAGTLTKYTQGEWIRVITGDFTTEDKDFLGRIIKISQVSDSGTEDVLGRENEVEIVAAEFHAFELRDLEVRRDGSGGAKSFAGIAGDYLTDASFVSAVSTLGPGNTKNPVTKGRYAFDLLRQLALENGCRMVGSAQGEFAMDTSHPSSGETFDDDDIRTINELEDGYSVMNRLRSYTVDGADGQAMQENTTLQRSAGYGPAAGVRTQILADGALTSTAGGGDADDLATNVLGRYGTAPKFYEAWIYGGHNVEPGETVTITYGPRDLTAISMIVMLKRYVLGTTHMGIQFILVAASVGEVWRRGMGAAIENDSLVVMRSMEPHL